MRIYDDQVLDVFLEKQGQLFDERVAATREEAEEFLEDCMDMEGAGEEEMRNASEVFEIGDGRYLIVEG